MSLLAPLGLLGLLGLVALIIIYIIKHNYQTKIISTTYIWKLSLKLRKKQIPISKLRNIILFICQVLAITTLTFILAQPVIAAEKEEEKSEKIAINMNTPKATQQTSHHATPQTIITTATIIAATRAINSDAFSLVFTVIIIIRL